MNHANDDHAHDDHANDAAAAAGPATAPATERACHEWAYPEWACQRAVTRMYWGVDERRYDEVVAQFAPDGVWHRQGKAVTGSAALMAAMQARPPSQATRHVLTNFVAAARTPQKTPEKTPETMDLRCYLHTYVHDSGRVEERPIVARSPTRLLLVTARMVRLDAGWRIAELRSRPEFDFTQH